MCSALPVPSLNSQNHTVAPNPEKSPDKEKIHPVVPELHLYVASMARESDAGDGRKVLEYSSKVLQAPQFSIPGVGYREI